MDTIMEIINGLDFHLKNSSVSLGKFDGIHRGHQYLLSKIKARKNLISTAFTFETGSVPKIYTQREKDRILEKLGVEREIIFPFQEETKNMSAEDFIEKILVEKMDAKYICVGEDFRFGKERTGDVGTLEKYQERFGYTVEVVKKLTCDRETISSTKIRDFLRDGDMEMAARFLGEEYFISGTVLSGEEIGRKLNSPTANLLPEEDKILPKFGVYATVVLVNGREFSGVSNVGVKPTVGKFPAGVETTLFQFHDDLYGKEIQVQFCKFLREERKFPSLEALKEQIESDKKDALRYLNERYTDYGIPSG